MIQLGHVDQPRRPAGRHRCAQGYALCRAGGSCRGTGSSLCRPSADRPPEVDDRQAQSGEVRLTLGADRSAARPTGNAVGRPGDGRHGRRTGRREVGEPDGGVSLYPQATVAPAISGRPAARARGGARSTKLSVLWRQPLAQAGRGYHRDAGGHSAAVEDDPDGAREVLVPRLRGNQPAACAVPRRLEPANSHDFLPRAWGRIARSTILLSISMRPSSRKRSNWCTQHCAHWIPNSLEKCIATIG